MLRDEAAAARELLCCDEALSRLARDDESDAAPSPLSDEIACERDASERSKLERTDERLVRLASPLLELPSSPERELLRELCVLLYDVDELLRAEIDEVSAELSDGSPLPPPEVTFPRKIARPVAVWPTMSRAPSP